MIIVSRHIAILPNFLCDMILMMVDDGGWVEIIHDCLLCRTMGCWKGVGVG